MFRAFNTRYKNKAKYLEQNKHYTKLGNNPIHLCPLIYKRSGFCDFLSCSTELLTKAHRFFYKFNHSPIYFSLPTKLLISYKFYIYKCNIHCCQSPLKSIDIYFVELIAIRGKFCEKYIQSNHARMVEKPCKFQRSRKRYLEDYVGRLTAACAQCVHVMCLCRVKVLPHTKKGTKTSVGRSLLTN